MTILLSISIIYFLLGCVTIVFSVWPVGNKFSKYVVGKFASPNEFNKWLTYVWLYPTIALALLSMFLQAFK